MARNTIKGLTVEISGDTTKLGKALEGVNKKSADLSSELGDINRLLKLDPKNTELLAQKQKVLADAVANTRQKLDTLKEAESQVQAQFEKGEASEEQVRELQREIIATTNKLEGYEKAAQETAKAVDDLANSDVGKLTRQLDEQRKELEQLKNKHKEVAKSQGNTSDEAKDLGKQIQKLTGEIEKNEKRLDDTEKAAKDAAGGLDKVADSADKAEKETGEMGTNLVSLAKGGLAAVAAAASAAVAGLSAASVNAAAFADEILTMSTVTGVSTDDLQAFSYASELVDVSLETLTKSMAKNIKSMQGAKDGSKAYKDAYKQLGVAVTDSNGKLRDSETVYWETIDALGKLENETERDAMAMQLFGKSAQELNPMIEAGADKMQELTKEAHEVGAVMGEDALGALGAFDDSIQRLKGSAGAAQNSLGSVLLPELMLLTDTGTDLLSTFTQKLNASGGGLDGLVETIGSMAGEIGSTVGTLAAELIDKIRQLAPTLVQVAVSLVTTLATSIISMVPTLLSTVMQLVTIILSGLSEAIPKLAAAITEMVPQLAQALADGLPLMLEAAVNLLLSLVSAVGQILPVLVQTLPQIVTTIVTSLLSQVPVLLQGAIQLLLAVVQAIPVLVASLAEQLPVIIQAIIDTLLTGMPLLYDGAKQLLLAITEAIPAVVQALIPALPQIIESIVSLMIQWFPMLWSAAFDLLMAIVKAIPTMHVELMKALPQIIDGLAKGLLDGLKTLGPTVKKFCSSLIKSFKEAFGIRSPSRVMAEIGDFLVQGLINTLKNLPGSIGTVLSSALTKVTTWASNMRSKAITAAKNVFSSIVNGLKNLPTQLATIGGNLVQGLWTGLNNKLSWLKSKISSFTSSVLGSIKSFFGVNSPSKETAWIGEMLDEGLSKGILDNMADPVKAMGKVSGGILDAAQTPDGLSLDRQLQATGSAAAAASASNTTLLAKLDKILSAVEAGQVIALDGKKLVGETFRQYDTKLGQQRDLALRGAI